MPKDNVKVGLTIVQNKFANWFEEDFEAIEANTKHMTTWEILKSELETVEDWPGPDTDKTQLAHMLIAIVGLCKAHDIQLYDLVVDACENRPMN